MKRIKLISLLMVLVLAIGSISVVHAEDTDDYKTFIQGDDRWGSYVYDSGCTLRGSGCMITAIAILMAYANPDLRDVESFNPQILAEKLGFVPEGCICWGTTTNFDSTFSLVDMSYSLTSDGTVPTEEEANEGIKKLLDEGYYVIIRTEGLYSPGGGHYSPIVGYEDGKPLVWDVAGGGKTWDDWNANGLSQVVVYQSSLNPSNEALTDSIDSSQRDDVLSDEQKEAYEGLVSEWEAMGGEGVQIPFGVEQANITLPTQDGLTQSEKDTLVEIKANINDNKKTSADIFSTILTFLGLVLMSYSILMFAGCVVDRVNTWIDMSVVSILSFGKIRLVPQDEEHIYKKTKPEKGLLTTKQWVMRCIAVLVIGIVFVSGAIQEFLTWVLLKIKGL